MIYQRKIKNQTEIVEKTGFQKGTVSNIITKTKPAGWEFVVTFSEAYKVLLSTELSTENAVSQLRENDVGGYKTDTFHAERERFMTIIADMAATMRKQQDDLVFFRQRFGDEKNREPVSEHKLPKKEVVHR